MQHGPAEVYVLRRMIHERPLSVSARLLKPGALKTRLDMVRARILLIEDSPTYAELATMLLEASVEKPTDPSAFRTVVVTFLEAPEEAP